MSMKVPLLALLLIKLFFYWDLTLVKPIYFVANDFVLGSYDLTVYTLAEHLYLKYPILLCVVGFFLLLCMVGALAILRATL